VAELNLGMLHSRCKKEGLVTEGVSKYDLAALVNKVISSLSAKSGLRNVLLIDYLGIAKTENSLDLLNAVDEVEVVGRSLVMKADNTDLEILGNSEVLGEFNLGERCFGHISNSVAATARGESKCECADHSQSKNKG
jgi:hypothetical protein